MLRDVRHLLAFPPLHYVREALMGAVVQLVTEDAVDRAWTAYCDYARRLAAQPSLLCDRPFYEEMTRRHERWRRLFLLQEAGQ